jgi:hypothetical protein
LTQKELSIEELKFLKESKMNFEGDLITEYIERGYNLCPVSKGTKDQYLHKWSLLQEKKATLQQINGWRGKYNSDWVLVCGKQNNNIIVIDFDDPEIYERYFSEYKKMLSRSPSGGYHLYIKAKKLPGATNGFGGFLIDIKGEGGVCHIPPSEGNDWIFFESEPDKIDINIEDWILSLLPSGKIESKYKTGEIPADIFGYAREKLKITFEDKKGRYLKCTCPFHRGGKETDGSLTIFAHDQKFWCFSCHKKGGMFELIKEFETGITENEILERYGLVKEPGTIVQKIVKLAKDSCKFVKDQNNTTYAVIVKNQCDMDQNIYVIDSLGFRWWLAHNYEATYEVLPSDNQASQAMKHLAGFAITKGERIRSFNRIGMGNNNSKEIFYDIGDGSYLKIEPDDINVVKSTDLFFRRESHQGIQVLPHKFNPMDTIKLFDIINVKEQKSKLLLIAWLVTSLLPDEEHPVLLLHGSQGAGKSVAARITKRLIDPTSSEKNELSRLNAKDYGQITFTLAHNFVTIFDNISFTDKSIDDILCLGVTGGSEIKRALFTNSETVSTDISSTIILTTINPDLITAGDLGDRSIQIELDRPVGKFLNRKFIDAHFNSVKPDIFGGLIALVQLYLEKKEELEKEPSNFRMTTYAAVGKLVAETLGLGSFEEAYMADQLYISRSVLENEPLSQFVYYMADNHPKTPYSFSDLLTEMQNWANENGINTTIGKDFPTGSKGISQKLKRLEEDLRRSWKIVSTRCDVNKSRGIMFSKPGAIDLREAKIDEEE